MSTATATIAPAIQIGTCTACSTTYRVEVIEGHVITELGGETLGYCGCRAAQGQADSYVKFGKSVEVIFAAEVVCGARCYSAKSSACKCSCSGEGHGLAHKVGGE